MACSGGKDLRWQHHQLHPSTLDAPPLAHRRNPPMSSKPRSTAVPVIPGHPRIRGLLDAPLRVGCALLVTSLSPSPTLKCWAIGHRTSSNASKRIERVWRTSSQVSILSDGLAVARCTTEGRMRFTGHITITLSYPEMLGDRPSNIIECLQAYRKGLTNILSSLDTLRWPRRCSMHVAREGVRCWRPH
jgi:hypothetical protein